MPGSVCADPRGACQVDNGEALCRPSTSYHVRTPALAPAGPIQVARNSPLPQATGTAQASPGAGLLLIEIKLNLPR